MIRTGVPPSVAPRLAGSNTHTSARGMPGVVICGSPAPGTPAIEGSLRCCPRWAVVIKARDAVPRRDKSARRGTGEDDIARLIAHQQRANHVRRAGQADDAHAIR